MPDSEILRLEKRQRGLQRVATAINDLSIYGIYHTNFPKLIQVLEHAKDHVKAEIIEQSTIKVEEVYTDPLKSEAQQEAEKVNDMYTTKGI
jgi:hypothetical protein